MLLPILLALNGCATVFEASPPLQPPAGKQPAAPSATALAAPSEAPASAGEAHVSEQVLAREPIQLVFPPGDLWERIRLGFTIHEMDNDPAVRRAAKRYVEQRFLEHTVPRAAPFLHHVVDEVQKRSLPMELALLPFVESGYALEARSTAEARGAWQFIADTARTYDLDIDRLQDERRSLVASTRAALDYLQSLHGQFGNWPLAFAAYNWGEKRVQAEVDRLRAKGRKNPGFNDLRLPPETRQYVPRILALKKLVADPANYRLALPVTADVARYVSVSIPRDIDVAVAARLSGTPLAEFRALNPHHLGPMIVGGSGSEVLLPLDAARRLSDGMATYDGTLASWRRETLLRAATPHSVARRYAVPLLKVLAVNRLGPGQIYPAGTTLLLPTSAPVRSSTAAAGQARLARDS